MASLAGSNALAAGRLYTDLTQLHPQLERKDFERILKCLGQARWLEISEASFQKGTETISYRKVSQTEKGRKATAEDLAQLKRVGSSFGSTGFTSITSSSQKKPKPTRLKKSRSKAPSPSESVSGDRLGRAGQAASDHSEELTPAASLLFESLRSWRLEIARKRGIPAFRILSDRVLKLISAEQPLDADAVRTIKGVGPKLADLYGREIIRIVNSHG